MSVNFALKCCCLNHTILSRISPWEILVKLYVSQHSSAKTLRFIQCWVRLCVQPFPHTCVHTGRFFFAKLCIVDKIQTHKRLKRMLFIMLFWCPVFGSAGHQKQQKGLTPAIRMLCFAILNSVLLTFYLFWSGWRMLAVILVSDFLLFSGRSQYGIFWQSNAIHDWRLLLC